MCAALAKQVTDDIVEELWFHDEPTPFDPKAQAVQSLAVSLAMNMGLRPFPVVAGRVLALTATNDFDLEEAIGLVESDITLASRVLRHANCALLAGTRPCRTVRAAFVRLGTTIIRELVVAVAMMSMFEDACGNGRMFRDHSAGSGALARALGRAWAPDIASDLFLAGMLHDIGKLFLVQSGEFPYTEFRRRELHSADATHEAERFSIGFDHAVLGGHILLAWDIPDPIPRLVAWHHQPGRLLNAPELRSHCQFLRLVDRLEHAMASKLDTLALVEHLEPDLAELGRDPDELEDLLPFLVESHSEALSLVR